MPQRLPPSVTEMSIGPHSLAERPQLAAMLAEAIAAWAIIEMKIGYSLSRLLDSTPDVAVSMYQALESTSAQKAIVNAAAEKALRGHDLAVFQAIMKLAHAAHKERSGIAHGLWGTSSQYPDGLIWVDARLWLDVMTQQDVHARRFKDDPQAPEPRFDLFSHMRGYREGDFKRLIARINRVGYHLNAFWDEAEHPDGLTRQTLDTAPDILEVMLRSNGGRKSSPSVPHVRLHSSDPQDSQ